MIWSLIKQRALSHPERSAVVWGERVVSYGQLVHAVEARTQRLPPRSGDRRTTRVLVQQSNPLSLLVHLLTAWAAGVVPVVLRDGTTTAQVEELREILQPAADLFEEVEKVEWDGCTASPSPVRKSFGSSDEALVLCTSGTTGSPKLVALSAHGVATNAGVIADSLMLSATDRVAVTTPLTYMYGLMGGTVATLMRGATLVLFSPAAPLTEVQAGIRHHAITVVQGPPSLMRLFLAYWNEQPFEGVRMVTTGGEPLGTEVRAGLMRAFPRAHFLFLYGMTEAGPRLSHLAFADGGGMDNLVGCPYPHVRWRLHGEDSSKADNVRRGRLVIGGESIFLGYIQADGSYGGKDEQGWFVSSDLVELVDDQKMRFLGRVDRLFKSGGKLVSPDEVERALRRLPQVEDAKCFAESHRLLGLVPVAEVKLNDGYHCHPADILKALRSDLEPQARPRSIRVVPGWKLAESGKKNVGIILRG